MAAACNSATEPDTQVVIRAVSVAPAYRHGVGWPIRDRFGCDQVVLSAALEGGRKVETFATWGDARLTLRTLDKKMIIHQETFPASQVSGWWGRERIYLGARPEMVWHVWVWDYVGFLATFEYDYTRDTGAKGTASYEITCRWLPG